MEEARCQLAAHPLPQGELAHRLAPEGTELEQVDQLVPPPPRRRRLQVEHPLEEVERLGDRKVIPELRPLPEDAPDLRDEAGPVLPRAEPQDFGLPGGGVEDPGEDLDGGALAGPVGADEGDPLPLGYLDRHSVDRVDGRALGPEQGAQGPLHAGASFDPRKRLAQSGRANGGGHPGRIPRTPGRLARPERLRDTGLVTNRSVPSSTRLVVMFGGGLQQLGWFLLLFSTPFFWLFVPLKDIVALPLTFGPMQVANGVIETSERGGASEGDVEVHVMTYTFYDQDEVQHLGKGYATGWSQPAGSEVSVEYPAGFPGLSRIDGMRRSTFGYAATFVIIFPLVGLGFVWFGIRRGRQWNRLLRNGELALGRLIGKTATNTTVNDRPVYRLRFEYVTERGQQAYIEARTSLTERLEDEEEEILLYDPRSPDQGVLLDQLPGAVAMDAEGRITEGAPVRGLAVFVLPSVVAAANLLAAWMTFTP